MVQESKLNKEYIYLISPYGLGDTMILCGFREALVKRYGYDVCYVVKPSHECIVQMYGIENYEIARFDENELRQLASETKSIKAGKLYVAHPTFHENNILFDGFYAGESSFLGMYRNFLGLSTESVFEEPERYPEISDELAQKLGDINVEEAVLIAPEMNSGLFKQNIYIYFKAEIQKCVDMSTEVVLNCMGKAYDEYAALNVEMTLEELIAVAIRCKKVITARSGLSDLIYFKARSMEVVYPSRYFQRLYDLEVDFGKRDGVTSYIAPRKNNLELAGYGCCAIYGMGYIGQNVLMELQTDGYSVSYVIDRRAESMSLDVPCHLPTDELPEVDVVVVAVENGTEEIMAQIEQEHSLRTYNYRYLFE